MSENIFGIVMIILSVLFYYGIYRLIRFILRGGLKFTRSESLFSAQRKIISQPNNNELYEHVADELRKNSIKQGLWAKAFSESDGDKSKTQAAYIRYRISELQQKHGGSSEISTNLSEKVLFGLLRFIRGVFGFIFVLQLIHVIEAAASLLKPEAVNFDMGNFFALLLVKAAFFMAAGFLFFGLRWLINRIYINKYGIPHPSLAEKKWAL